MANDLDQSVSNAIAGGVSGPVDLIAWALRKAGVPGLEKPVMGSDWMREKGLTAPVKSQGAAIVGETVGNLLDPLAALGKGAAAIKAGLYVNALRPELMASHSAPLHRLMTRDGDLPQELYNPSFAVRSGKVSDFGGMADIRLIGQEGLLDPRTSPSVLTAFDSFSPRYRSGAGSRSDWIDAALTQFAGKDFDAMAPADKARLIQALVRENANARLTDKFVSTYPKGGIFGESAGKSSVTSLPAYGRGGYKFDIRKPPKAAEALQEFSYGHRFPTFQAYEKSPIGAARLSGGPGSDDLYGKIDTLLGTADATDYFTATQKLSILKDIAKGGDTTISGTGATVTSREAQDLLKALRRTRSDYAELKGFGPLQINRNNIAGIIDPGNNLEAANWYKPLAEQLRRQAKKRGIPYEHMSRLDYTHAGLLKHEKKIAEVARQMQELRK